MDFFFRTRFYLKVLGMNTQLDGTYDYVESDNSFRISYFKCYPNDAFSLEREKQLLAFKKINDSWEIGVFDSFKNFHKKCDEISLQIKEYLTKEHLYFSNDFVCGFKNSVIFDFEECAPIGLYA